jgi:polar amino acid transport system substrate-binding protein
MLDDARRVKAIAVYADDSRAQYLTEQGFYNLVTLSDEAACLRALAAGEVDLAMTSDIGGFLVAERAGLDPADFEAAYTFNEVELYISFQKDTPQDIVRTWQQALDEIRAAD